MQLEKIFKKIFYLLTSKIFWFFVLLYMSIRLVRTGSQDQDYGWFTNFFFPIVENPNNLFYILFFGFGVWIIWILDSVKDKKIDFF